MDRLLEANLLYRVLLFLQPFSLYTLCQTSIIIRAQTLSSFPSLHIHLNPTTLAFSPNNLPIAQLVAKALFLPHSTISLATSSLDNLHNKIRGYQPSLIPSRGKWKEEANLLWKDNGLKEFSKKGGLYEKLVEQLVAKLELRKYEKAYYYSKVPLIRFCPPLPLSLDELQISSSGSDNNGRPTGTRCAKQSVERIGVLTGRHSDGGYGHPTGEINFWLPVNTRAFETNSLWVDRTPWSGVSSSSFLELKYGECGVFYGNQCPHETKRNVTPITRVSFDFRIVPGSLYESNPAKKSFGPQYWTLGEF